MEDHISLISTNEKYFHDSDEKIVSVVAWKCGLRGFGESESCKKIRVFN